MIEYIGKGNCSKTIDSCVNHGDELKRKTVQ